MEKFDYVQQTPELKEKYEKLLEQQKNDFPNRKFLYDYKYIENHNCLFYPCHSNYDIEKYGFNCMFCRCPYFSYDTCPGIELGDGKILSNGVKDCTNCTYNHEYKNATEMSLVI